MPDNDSLIAATSSSSAASTSQNNNPSGSWTSGAFMPSILSPFSFNSATNSNLSQQRMSSGARGTIGEERKEEVIDFTETYVNVQETDADEVDILLNGGDPGTGHLEPEEPPLDALAVLLSGSAQNNAEKLVSLSEQATSEMNKAVQAKKKGDMQKAVDAHSAAARLFHEAAVELRDMNASMAQSFLLLSQTEAKSALGLKRIMKARPHGFGKSGGPKESFRQTFRGALDHKQPEEDLSESVFLGKAKRPHPSQSNAKIKNENETPQQNNPIDEMMKLERELLEMDMALQLGNSIASLDTKSRMKTMDGSFMVVPPGSTSYMSSSMVLNQPPPSSTPSPVAPRSANRPSEIYGTAGVRARANRVQSVAAAPQTSRRSDVAPTQIVAPAPKSNNHGLESSWWGNSSAVASSQILSSSVISLASHTGSVQGGDGGLTNDQPANNKQLMRLMDSLKRLGDENAALLREVEQAEAARAEAKAARQEMRRFKQEYSKRFETLKGMLEKFRKNNQGNWNTDANPVISSEFLIAATTSEQLSRQEQLIRKLTADLKKEKEEAKKKEVIFKRYESFYREVKAMSAQKAAQRKAQNRASPQAKPKNGSSS